MPNKNNEKPLKLKQDVEFVDLIGVSLNSPPATPAPKKKPKKKPAKKKR